MSVSFLFLFDYVLFYSHLCCYDFLLLRFIILPLFVDIRLFHLYVLVFCAQLIEAFYRYSVDHYVITRASGCVIARIFLLTCKLYFFIHVNVRNRVEQ
jgi:hypothetical protein